MGEAPDRPDRIAASSTHLLRGERPWFPVMGEFHFARFPREGWRDQVLSMRAGGIDLVATYLFWHHHEERRGRFRFDGNRDVRAFLEVVAECGLDAVVRVGPWSHGEARHGGFPDWVQHSGTGLRTDDPAYLELVAPYYAQIAEQLRGLHHAEGGPIVAVQIENELYDQPEHLRTLKRMAHAAGMAPALWTATAWGGADLPADEFLPVHAGYPEAPWDDAHPGWARHNRRHFFFTPLRDDHTVGADLRRDPTTGEGAELDRYPYATCELGGGMQVTYHRRPLVDPHDVAALALTKIGCGSVWQGYYMYQGGSHVMDGETTMQESLETGYPNDLPVVSYDFQAPLGEYGQVRPQYGLLRLQHHLIAAAGERLAPMGLAEPDQRPRDLDDRDTLRWAVRSDGRSGMVFVNTHQPGGETLAAHAGVQFALTDAVGSVRTVPSQPVDIPSGAYFAWPFGWELPAGVTLESASAQLVAVLDDLVVLTRTAGIPVELVLAGVDPAVGDDAGPGLVRVAVPEPGPGTLLDLGPVRVLVLDETTAVALTIGHLWGARRLVVGEKVHVVPDGDRLHVETGADGGAVLVHPPVTGPVSTDDGRSVGAAGTVGVFSRFEIPPAGTSAKVELTETAAGSGPAPRRTGGPLGRAAAPTDADHESATELRVDLDPQALDGVHRLYLRIDWTGDVARAYLDGVLVADDFWNGRPWEIDLLRHRSALMGGAELTLRLLPFDPEAAVHVRDDLRPETVTLEIDHVELVPVRRIALVAGAR